MFRLNKNWNLGKDLSTLEKVLFQRHLIHENAEHRMYWLLFVNMKKRRWRSFRYVLRHRLQRGVRDSIGIQKIYGEYEFVLDKCGLYCRSPEFVRRLHPITVTVNFVYEGKPFTLIATVYFQPHPSKSFSSFSLPKLTWLSSRSRIWSYDSLWSR